MSAESPGYTHPITFQQTGDVSADFAHSWEDYTANVGPLIGGLDYRARVLDVGCGWGQFLAWLKSRGFVNAVGVDRDAAQVLHCRGLDLIADRVENVAGWLEARPEEFDVITLHHVIEHMNFDEGLRLLTAMRRALRDGGRVILQTPNMSAICAGFARHIEVTHVTGYTETSLHELLLLAGFRPVAVWGNRRVRRLSARRLVWVAAQGIGRAVWRALLVAEMGTDAPRILNKNIYAVGHKQPAASDGG